MSGPPVPPRPPHQSPHPTYNPQAYAQQSNTPPTPYQPYSPHPSQASQPPPHRPYNPAAYHDNSIASAANNIYGPATGAYPHNVSSYGPRGGSQGSSPNIPQGYPPASPPQHYNSHIGPSSSYRAAHRYSASAPGQQPYRPPSNPPHSPPQPSPAFYDAFPHQPMSPTSRFPAPPQHSPSPNLDDRFTPPTNRMRNDTNTNLTSAFPAPPNSVPMPEAETHLQNVERHQSTRHPQQRPLPGPPTPGVAYPNGMRENEEFDDALDDDEARRAQDDLYEDLERSLLNTGSFAQYQPASTSYLNSQPSSSRQSREHINGHPDSAVSGPVSSYYEDYDDDDSGDSDPEAAAGLEAMRMAEEQEEIERDRRSRSSSYLTNGTTDQGQSTLVEQAYDEAYVDDDMGGIDMSSFAGGFAMPMTHRDDSASLPASSPLLEQRPSVSSRRTVQTDYSGSTVRTASGTSIPTMNHFYPATAARVDESGTGGLADPTSMGRRMSFENDDPAERAYIMQQAQQAQQQAQVPADQMIPETYHQHPTYSGGRPLPTVPAQNEYYVSNPAAYAQHASIHGNNFPRSHSLGTTSSASQTVPPTRAKTDAEEKRKSGLRAQAISTAGSTPVASIDAPDLPSLPAGRRVQPSKLRPSDYDKCTEPWALSTLTRWLRSVAEGDPELKSNMIEEILVNLFTYKVANLNIPVAEALSSHTMQVMYASGTLIHDEEWLRFGGGEPTGVLYQLTGKGCYSQALHNHDVRGRCYSHHCQRTIRKMSVDEGASAGPSDWATYYSLKKEDVADVDKKEIERQNNLHEIVQSEYKYINDLKLLRSLYQQGLEKSSPKIIPPKNLDTFNKHVFSKLAAVQRANEDFLLPQLLYRQKEQGPWVVGFSDIFRDWIRKAKPAYIDYTANYPNAEFMIRQEDRRNLMFHNFLDTARNDPRAQRLAWDHYLKAPITKIQRYSLLLQTVLKNMKQDSEEKANLQRAVEEIQETTRECNTRLADETRKIQLLDLQARLKLRPEMSKIELNLTQWGRELIFTGELQRLGGRGVTLLDTHAILLDNFLVLAKTISGREGKSDQYDVSKMPIPMELLMLESADDDPVVKSSMKGISAVSTANTAKQTADPRMVRTTSSPRPGSENGLQHVTSSNSTQLVTSTSLDQGQNEKLLFPFKIKHLGKDLFTLYANSVASRREWCDKIIEAKTKHAASLFSQNAEPFRLNVIADTAFANETGTSGPRQINIKGTPLMRAIENVEKRYKTAGRPAPICRARVNCATSFTWHNGQQNGKQMLAIGTDYGVYTCEAGDPRGWTKAIIIPRVTQVAVLEDFSLFLLISDKSLIAYHLDVVTSAISTTSSDPASIKKSPQKLSGSNVGFFAVGRMKDRTLVFYEKTSGRSSNFIILEPVYQKSSAASNSSSRAGRWLRGHTDYFRDYDIFYIPTDCRAIDLFNTTLAVSTSKGFEVLTVDKKQVWTIPDLAQPHVATIKTRLENMNTVAMFRLAADGSELLCVYEECAVYVNKYGDVSRSVVMEFVGRARNASLVGGYLVLFDNDFVEVRDALNGRLKQVVAGRDVRCLDNGRSQPGQPTGGMSQGATRERSVKFALQHPENEKAQIVVELCLNEARRD